MTQKTWKVYLSGEIHSDWRQVIKKQSKDSGLPIHFDGPQDVHEKSDDCGEAIIGKQESAFWRDNLASGINSIRTKTLLNDADVVVVRFGEKYKQWNAAFDAGFAAALGKPLIIMHGPGHSHALKEVDGAAQAVLDDLRVS